MVSLQSTAFHESRALSKTITSLESDLSSAKNQVSILRAGEKDNIRKAVKEAKNEERRYFHGVIEKEKVSSTSLRKRLDVATRKEQVRSSVPHFQLKSLVILLILFVLKRSTARAIAAERGVRNLRSSLERQKGVCAHLMDAVTKQNTVSAAIMGDRATVAPVMDQELVSTGDAVLEGLISGLGYSAPSRAMQDFAAKVLLKCTNGDSFSGSLLRRGRRAPVVFSVARQTLASPKQTKVDSQRRYIRKLISQFSLPGVASTTRQRTITSVTIEGLVPLSIPLFLMCLA